MSDFTAAPRLPVDPGDRGDVIDLVNRLNMAVDEWDLEAMFAAFTEDGVVHHPFGVIRGHDAFRKFYDAYRPLTLGVRRHSLNHIVHAHEDGTLSVRHYTVLVGVAPAERADDVRRADLTYDATGLPTLFMHSIVTDRFRKDPGHAGGSWKGASIRRSSMLDCDLQPRVLSGTWRATSDADAARFTLVFPRQAERGRLRVSA
jgi:hypothetical protein